MFTVNPDHLYHLQYNPAFVQAYRSADIITVDSHYVRLALRLLGRTVANRLPGSDIVPAFCARNAANPDVRIFLLGARPGVAQAARESMNRKAGRELVVGAHGPSMNFVERSGGDRRRAQDDRGQRRQRAAGGPGRAQAGDLDRQRPPSPAAGAGDDGHRRDDRLRSGRGQARARAAAAARPGMDLPRRAPSRGAT